MKRLFLLFVFLFASLAMSVFGQAVTTVVRVHSLEQLNAAKQYAVLSKSPNGIYYFLSDVGAVAGKPTKAAALELEPNALNETIKADVACLWDITFEDGKITLSRAGKFLTGKGDALGLSAKAQLTENAEWEVVKVESDVFLLKQPASNSRSLCVQSSGGVPCFDNYSISAESGAVYLYEADESTTPPTGNAERPADGERVALFSSGKVCADGGSLSIDGLYLSDGSLASVEGLQSWKVEGGANKLFYLKGEGGYLDYNLNEGGDKTAWQVKNGLIMTAEEANRYLRFDPVVDAWGVTQDPKQGKDVTFQKVADKAGQTLTEDGVLRLTGGWSRASLASLPLADIRCLDLTAIALPMEAGDFETKLEELNMPIFVSESSVQYVPSSWRFVVRCGKSGNSLLRQVVLKDKAAFYTDRDFKVGDGKMVYEREVNLERSPWQTLCLPFQSTQDGTKCYKVQDVQGTNLLLRGVTFLETAVPHLIFCDRSPIRFVSEATTVYRSNPQQGVLNGVFLPFDVTAHSENVYLLSPETQYFVHAAAGSKLSPFRAYIRLDKEVKSVIRPTVCAE